MPDIAHGVLIPELGEVTPIELPPTNWLTQMQAAVGGLVEQVLLPPFLEEHGGAVMFINEEGAGILPPNMRATDFLVPGIGLAWGQVIYGPAVLVGDDREHGELADLPARVLGRITLIVQEAGV